MALAELWLPILISAVFVFIVSSVIHMVIPIHKADWSKLTGETEVMAGMRAQGVKPGQYMFPHCNSMKEMGQQAHIDKLNQGPVGFLQVLPNGPMAMGKSLTQWFIFSAVVGLLVAYVASLVLVAGEGSMMVFRVTSAVAFIGYGLGVVPESIWKGGSWIVTAKFLFDGLLYGLATGAAFAWFWPSMS